MNEPAYNLGDTISGTIGKVVSKTFGSNNDWVYCIEFNGNFLTISEKQIDRMIIEAMRECGGVNNG